MGRAEEVARTSVHHSRSSLALLSEQVRPTTLAGEHRLAVLPALEPLLPGGLRRGSTLTVEGPAATSLALATAVGASRDGAWVAAVGFPSLGLAAAAELGIALHRLVLVADPEQHDAGSRASVVAALVDAFDVVLVRADRPVRGPDARRLVARARERGAVLVLATADAAGGAGRRARPAWPERADVELHLTEVTWEGLGEGHGHLRSRRVTVVAGGRREAARTRRVQLWLPSADGTVEPVLPDPVPLRPMGPSAPAQVRAGAGAP